MKIYTKTGEKGETALFGGERVPKDALRIEAYGTVDELNSLLGVVRSLKPKKKIDSIVDLLQHQLFELGADLATPKGTNDSHIPRITAAHAGELEKVIDALESKLKPLKVFILPGGSKLASHIHLARTVCRRVERTVVRLSRNEEIGEDVIIYLNRLSDLLFVMARFANHIEKHPEIEWSGAKRRNKK
ncbi:MAG: cob(I)yrinic acid a,c-diamide adenosyltransferase [Ignavibacteriales bacterium]|nr:cob(I)yrinic acid a,c-diamide adenosyltransferase [Ignavibacteriales bacterium]